VSKRLSRGTVVVTVRHSDESANAAAQVNGPAIQRYLEQLFAVPGLDHESARIDLGALLALPGVIITDSEEDRLKQAREVLLHLLSNACDGLIEMRRRVGASLRSELHRHCEVVANHLRVVAERVPEMIRLYQEKLRQRMALLLKEVGATVREEDLLREVAVFAERCDIAEEVARLEGHLEQFRSLIDSDDEQPVGRTLDFIAQEMLREASA